MKLSKFERNMNLKSDGATRRQEVSQRQSVKKKSIKCFFRLQLLKKWKFAAFAGSFKKIKQNETLVWLSKTKKERGSHWVSAGSASCGPPSSGFCSRLQGSCRISSRRRKMILIKYKCCQCKENQRLSTSKRSPCDPKLTETQWNAFPHGVEV